MSRYFFDRVSGTRSEYDYQGRVLATPEKAYQLAELMALDLGVAEGTEWAGWTIDVRNALGNQFFSVPVREPALVAA